MLLDLNLFYLLKLRWICAAFTRKETEKVGRHPGSKKSKSLAFVKPFTYPGLLPATYNIGPWFRWTFLVVILRFSPLATSVIVRFCPIIFFGINFQKRVTNSCLIIFAQFIKPLQAADVRFIEHCWRSTNTIPEDVSVFQLTWHGIFRSILFTSSASSTSHGLCTS